MANYSCKKFFLRFNV